MEIRKSTETNRREYDRRYQRRKRADAKKAYAALMKFYPFDLEDLDGEIWKAIPDFEKYRISNFGRVKSFQLGKEKILKPQVVGNYLMVRLYNGVHYKAVSVHRLVAEVFISNPKSLPEVDHIDTHKLNCHVSNLRWVTSSQNIKLTYDNGRKSLAGTSNPSAKLTDEQVKYIRENPDGLVQAKLAEILDISQSTVSAIQRGCLHKKGRG